MSVFLDTSAALDEQLNIMTGVPPVAWENKEYEPTKDTLYLKPMILPGTVEPAGLGDTAQDDNIGIYQVTVFGSTGDGKNETVVMADNVADQFNRGINLTYNSQTVRITQVRRHGAVIVDGWYTITVDIHWQSFTEARI